MDALRGPYPEETSTGHVMTGLARRLALEQTVRVLCAQPTYSLRESRSPKSERLGEVHIERVWSTTLNKNELPYRLLNS